MRWLVGTLGVLLLLVFALFVARETVQLVSLTSLLHPTLGRATLVALLGIYAACLGIPLILFLRLRQPLAPPPESDQRRFRHHLELLSGRLSRNPLLGTVVITPDRESIEQALGILDRRAEEHITREASVVFLSTAISQSGNLDALLVLVAQSRMVWTIAHVYAQRPSLGQLLWLYTNVGATVFAAQAVEDLDLGEVLEPMIAPALATAAGGGTVVLAPLATIVADALLQGTANALLTLRVGCIARQYCRGLPLPDRRRVRRAATREAATMLGGIVMTHAGAVTTALWSAGKRIVAGKGRASMRHAARLATGGILGAAIYEAVRRALASARGGEASAPEVEASSAPEGTAT